MFSRPAAFALFLMTFAASMAAAQPAEPATSETSETSAAADLPKTPEPVGPKREPLRALRGPTAEEAQPYFPDRALRESVGGRAVLDCRLNASTRLDDCKVASETPSGYGFGEAARKISVFYRIAPPTLDGRPAEGARISIPFSFQPSPPVAADARSASDGAAPARTADKPMAPLPAAPEPPGIRAPATLVLLGLFAVVVLAALAWALLAPSGAPRRRKGRRFAA